VTKTKVVNRHHGAYDVFIGRPSKWGNPFHEGRDGTREEVIAKYREWILTQPELLSQLPELEGKRIACSCKPRACHGDVLVELLDGLITNELLQ
jgi:hypothetical protein